MRKSPGKWLKTLLSGKKPFRSSSTKSKNSSEKGLTMGYERLGDNSPIISEPVLVSTYGSTTLPIVEETPHSDMHGCEATRPVVIQSTVDQVASSLDESSSCDKLSQERAATKAQAAIRGFLARRAFRALKGIVRLQALIRGHLVRRQAIATLYAMHAIVRLQALFRARTTSDCDIGHQGYSARKQKCDLLNCTSGDAWKENFQVHSLGGRLLSSQIVFKPLQIQYNKENPNSTSNWLERWHMSHFWKPIIKTNRLDHSKDPEKKRRNWSVCQSVRTNSKLTKKLGPNSGPEKPKGNHHSQTPETPKTELEKPKRGLRKVSTTKPEADTGKLSSGSMKSQSKTVRETSKNSEAASKIMGAKTSEASLSSSADGEFTFHKIKSLPSFGVEVTGKDLHASATTLESVPDAATSKEKSLSGSRESTSKQNNRRKPSSSISRLEIPEKELHTSACSSASKVLPDGSPSKEKPSLSSRDSGNKSNHRRRSSLSSVSKTLPDGNPSEEKSGGGDYGNKLNNRRRSSLSNASKNLPDGNPSEEKSLSSSGDSGHKLNHRRRSSLTITRLEISETKLRASVDNCIPRITPDVNSSEEKSLSSNGERGNRPHNRRSSFSSGLEISEAELPSSASKSVPSYMASTESTKARLRGQNSPRVVTTPDTADKSDLMRRHSLPSGAANGKLKSVSPRAQKPVNSGGAKGVIKGGRSLNLSRNGSEKLVQAEWRRW